jgi:PIN like domain
MKNLFPGYFTPTEQEFANLWAEALFGFDANVLLGLYKSTPDTQQVFFDVLKKITDRIFLPHQAAREYLENRIGVISLRSDSYGKIKLESEKYTRFLESIIQDHALPNGKEIVTTANKAAKKIVSLAAAAEKEEPDLLHADSLLAKLAGLFETKTGSPFEQTRLKEIYADAANRYALGIPPGYKDEKKGEPRKYGDALIWFQLIDQARVAKKPIIFVTGDVKEDWWLQHKGATLGPRPELRQEMMAAAGVQFYMYTTPRFLEFAKQFLNLNFDTKKAETEFEEIEKQDKQTADQYLWQNWNRNFAVGAPTSGYITANYEPLNTFLASNSPTSGYITANYEPLNTFLASNNPASGYVTTDYGALNNFLTSNNPFLNFAPSSQAEQPVTPQTDSWYFQLLPLNRHVFQSSTGKWRCEILNEPLPSSGDHVCYRLRFNSEDRVTKERYLELWASSAALHQDSSQGYKSLIFGAILRWLNSNEISGRITLFR